MAQSLFGLTPEQIQEARRLQQQQAINQQAQAFGMFGPLYAAGRGMAQQGISKIAGLFPEVQDPQLAKATAIQELTKGKDLTNPAQLGLLARELAGLGYTQEAMLVAQEANKVLSKEEEMGLRARDVAARERDIEVRADERAQAAEERTRKITQVGTTIKGLNTYRKGTDETIYVTDEEGKEVKYDPRKHGRFETRQDAVGQRGVQIRDIPGPGGIGVIGREVYDSMTGNVIRREYLPGYGPSGSSPTAPAPSAAPNNRSPGRSPQAQRAREELNKRLGQQ